MDSQQSKSGLWFSGLTLTTRLETETEARGSPGIIAFALHAAKLSLFLAVNIVP